jgi:hypothetical protein
VNDTNDANDRYAGYAPLDLAPHCNSGAQLLGDKHESPVGLRSWHGLPFKIGGTSDARCLVSGGAQLGTAPVEIPVGRRVRWAIFAHRLLESELEAGGPLGAVVAEYEFNLRGVPAVRVPVRERFEIGTVPKVYGGAPFLALPDQQDELLPRYSGPWGQAGKRQKEGNRGVAKWFVLWAWQNPSPDLQLQSLTIIPAGPPFVVGGITLSSLQEDPFCRDPLRPVLITLPKAQDAAAPFDLEVEVDRGFAAYPYALPTAATEFLERGGNGWGEAQNPASSPAYVELAASPSATVTIKQHDEVLGQAGWAELREAGVVETPRLRLEVLSGERNWVHTRVVDAETGKPLACRVHFRSAEGTPHAPHGHHAHVNSNLDSWHQDVGGDVRLGQITYAYIDGTCQGWLPRGEVLVDVARGYEYEPLRAKVVIKPGQQHLELRLHRVRDMNAERWFSGDSHVHGLSAQGSLTEAQGEGLNVVNLLQSQHGSLFSGTEEFTGGPHATADGSTVVYVSQENRQHMLGHLSLLGLKQPVMPWCSDGLGEAEPGGTLEATLSDWADQCHEQGGTVIIPHLPNPNGEPATLIATGRADAVEMLRHGMYEHSEYYRYLNCGYRLPLVGGTDKLSSNIPVGLYRTYVYIPPNEPFSFDTWRRNLVAGRTFHSGGPLLRFSVDGQRVGDTLRLPGNGGVVEVVAEAESVLPIHSLQVVQEGRVVASSESAQGTRKLSLRAKVAVTGHSWLAARCGGPGYAQAVPHHDGWRRGIMAHTSPIYLACGGEWWMFNSDTATYMLTLMEGSIQHVRHSSRRHAPGEATHHHGRADHLTYLEEPFKEAVAAIHQRMHQLGISH